MASLVATGPSRGVSGPWRKTREQKTKPNRTKTRAGHTRATIKEFSTRPSPFLATKDAPTLQSSSPMTCLSQGVRAHVRLRRPRAQAHPARPQQRLGDSGAPTTAVAAGPSSPGRSGRPGPGAGAGAGAAGGVR